MRLQAGIFVLLILSSGCSLLIDTSDLDNPPCDYSSSGVIALYTFDEDLLIDFWVKFAEVQSETQGIISRDALGQDNGGHFTLLRLPGNEIELVIQGTGVGMEMVQSNALDTDTWHHIGVNFGPPRMELFVDGISVADVASVSTLAENDNPFVIGSSSAQSEEGKPDPLSRPLSSTELDHVRLSDETRTFALVGTQ